MKKAIFLSHVPAFPTDQGNRRVTSLVLEELAGMGFETDFVFTGKRGKVIDPMSAHKIEVHFPVDILESNGTLPPQKDSRKPLNRGAFDDFLPFRPVPQIASHYIFDLLEKQSYDLIVLNYIHAAGLLIDRLERGLQLPKVFLVTHDPLSQVTELSKSMKFDPGLRKCSAEQEAQILNLVDKVICLGGDEKAYYEQIGVTSQIEIWLPMRQAKTDALGKATASDYLYFAGGNNPMNVEAVTWFLNTSWKRIIQLRPSTHLVVAGGVELGLKRFAKTAPNVHFLGAIDQRVHEFWMNACAAVINPVLNGTGVSIRSIEALESHKRLISTTIGMRNLGEFSCRLCVTIGDEPIAFSDACLRSISDAPKCECEHKKSRRRKGAETSKLSAFRL